MLQKTIQILVVYTFSYRIINTAAEVVKEGSLSIYRVDTGQYEANK